MIEPCSEVTQGILHINLKIEKLLYNNSSIVSFCYICTCCKITFDVHFLCLNVIGAFLRWRERDWIFSMVPQDHD